jgi:hypothetical protein
MELNVSLLMEARLARHYYFAVRMLARETLSQRRGQTLTLVTVLLIPALGFFALTTDLGSIYAMRAKMQLAADAATLAGAQELISGDSVEAYVTTYLGKNPVGERAAAIEELVVNSDLGTVTLVINYQTHPLLLAPDGIGLKVRSVALVELADSGEVGKPVPPGNAYGWYKNEKSTPGMDSAVVRLTS